MCSVSPFARWCERKRNIGSEKPKRPIFRYFIRSPRTASLSESSVRIPVDVLPLKCPRSEAESVCRFPRKRIWKQHCVVHLSGLVDVRPVNTEFGVAADARSLPFLASLFDLAICVCSGKVVWSAWHVVQCCGHRSDMKARHSPGGWDERFHRNVLYECRSDV